MLTILPFGLFLIAEPIPQAKIPLVSCVTANCQGDPLPRIESPLMVETLANAILLVKGPEFSDSTLQCSLIEPPLPAGLPPPAPLPIIYDPNALTAQIGPVNILERLNEPYGLSIRVVLRCLTPHLSDGPNPLGTNGAGNSKTSTLTVDGPGSSSKSYGSVIIVGNPSEPQESGGPSSLDSKTDSNSLPKNAGAEATGGLCSVLTHQDHQNPTIHCFILLMIFALSALRLRINDRK